jgi:hemerythrin
MAIEWNEDLATGVKEIDAQHKELFKRINRLLDACKRGEGREEIDRVILFLGNYVVDHFGTEERLMGRYKYPEAESHKSLHENFLKRFSTLKDELYTKGERLITVIETNQLLGDWWINHIGKIDKALGKYLENKI